jgi:hypothetical protein
MLGKGLGNARKLVDAVGTSKLMDEVVPMRRGNFEVKVRLKWGRESGGGRGRAAVSLGTSSAESFQNGTKM